MDKTEGEKCIFAKFRKEDRSCEGEISKMEPCPWCSSDAVDSSFPERIRKIVRSVTCNPLEITRDNACRRKEAASLREQEDHEKREREKGKESALTAVLPWTLCSRG